MTCISNIIYDSEDIEKKFNGKKVILYGAGEIGNLFIEKFSSIEVLFIIDQSKKGYQNDIEIINLDKFVELNRKEKIIVTSCKYWKEIKDNLYKSGFNNDDFIIWNPYDVMDENIRDFITYNKKIWGCNKILSKKKILIPYVEFIDVHFVPLAYSANFLSKKYDSEIWGYLRYENLDDLYYKSIAEIYDSFNLSGIIDTKLDDSQMEKVTRLFESIWNQINSLGDWKKIRLYNIDFGTSFIRDYMRFYMPDFNPKSDAIKEYLKERLKMIVFWYDYFNNVNDITCVVLWDGVCRESFLRDIAISFGIPVYAIHYTAACKCTLNHHFGHQFKYYKQFFHELSDKEQKYGIEWAKRKLDARLHGDRSDISYMRCSVYEAKEKEPLLKKNEKIKVMICPHTFQDDIFTNGWQIFSSVFEWLCYLGEVSNKTNYDWYLKPHPVSDKRDDKINNMILERYPKIKILPKLCSPVQLKREGIQFALTIWGTIGHEYPALGIQVINAGNNPHIAFDFDWNPKTKKEYDDLIFNLDKLNKKVNMEEIYKFYCVHYLFYKHSNWGRQSVFFSRPEDFPTPRKSEDYTTDKLRKYLDFCTEEVHKKTLYNTKELFKEMDNYTEKVFYKNKVNMDTL